MSCKQLLIGQQMGTSLYQLTPSLSKVRQLSWPKFMLPMKSFQFKMCQPAVTYVFHYQCTRDVNKCGFHVEHMSSTNSHRTSVFLLDFFALLKLSKTIKNKKNVHHNPQWAEECNKSHQINCAYISITECLHKFNTTKCIKLQF